MSLFLIHHLFLPTKPIQLINPKREREVRAWRIRADYHKLDYRLDSITQTVFLSLSIAEGVFRRAKKKKVLKLTSLIYFHPLRIQGKFLQIKK